MLKIVTAESGERQQPGRTAEHSEQCMHEKKNYIEATKNTFLRTNPGGSSDYDLKSSLDLIYRALQFYRLLAASFITLLAKLLYKPFYAR